jgi:hypothetical protein
MVALGFRWGVYIFYTQLSIQSLIIAARYGLFLYCPDWKGQLKERCVFGSVNLMEAINGVLDDYGWHACTGSPRGCKSRRKRLGWYRRALCANRSA